MNRVTLAFTLALCACSSERDKNKGAQEQHGSASATTAEGGAACAARVREFEPWLTTLELEQRSHEVRTRVTLQVVGRAAVPVTRTIDWGFIGPGAIEMFDVSAKNYAETTLGKEPTKEALAAQLETIHDLRADPDKRGAAPDNRIRLDVDTSAPWSDVARVVNAATEAGYAEALFAFKATSPLKPPPGVDQNTESREVMDAAGERLRELRAACQPWERAMFGHEFLDDAAADARARAKETAAALIECNCAVDLDAVKKAKWQDSHWKQAETRVGILVKLAGAGGTAIELASETPWSEAHRELIERAPEGSDPPSLRFVAM